MLSQKHRNMFGIARLSAFRKKASILIEAPRIRFSSFHSFPDVKKRNSGQYYYDYGDIPKISIPLHDSTEGNIQINKDGLQEWFGVSESTLPHLPKFLIKPRLTASFGGALPGDMEFFRHPGIMSVAKWLSTSLLNGWSMSLN